MRKTTKGVNTTRAESKSKLAHVHSQLNAVASALKKAGNDKKAGPEQNAIVGRGMDLVEMMRRKLKHGGRGLA